MGTTGTDAAMPPQSTERLQALVQRIDDVLGSDGHLL
jgi:hypothetical protein